MSRLPRHPNIEHLRKQAKALLPELQQGDPAVQLADAQHAVARQYGFASWPKLKAYVESGRAVSPFRGHWIVNLDKSRRRPSKGLQPRRIHFAVDGDMLVINHSFIDDQGHERTDDQVVRADGISHDLNNGWAITANWRGSHVLETVTTRNGVETRCGRYEVGSDGSTLTISTSEQVIVLDRRDD